MKKEKEELESEIKDVRDVGSLAYNFFTDAIESGCDNLEDSEAVARQAAQKILENLRLDFTTPAGVIYLMDMFYVTWHEILEFLKSKVATHTDYTLNVGNLFEVGFVNGVSSDELEQGNIVPTITHLSSMAPNLTDDDQPKVVPAVAWNSKMIKQNPDKIREISQKVFEYFTTKCDLYLQTPEIIFPIFGYVYSALVTYVTLKRHESGEFSFGMDFCNCFVITAMLGKDMNTIIGFEPKQMQKLSTKNDGNATAANE